MPAIMAPHLLHTPQHKKDEVFMSHQLILFAHGSRDEQWKAPFEKLTKTLQEQLHCDRVYLAYMEMTTPTLMEAIQQAINCGATQLSILPLFMASGGHLRYDVPIQVQAAQKQFPDVPMVIHPPIGENPKVIQAMQQVALELMTD
jgi:sirohydrochlorin cobaltochelatase